MYENLIYWNYEECNWLNVQYGDQLSWFAENWGFLECWTFSSGTIRKEGEFIILTFNQFLSIGKIWFVKRH